MNDMIIYQIYPLGLCGAPFRNDGKQVSRILRILEWIPHLKQLGVNTILFNPVFASSTHGYDTRDYTQIDCRLGSNEDFQQVCDALHEAGFRIILDVVFNHTGRDFGPFRDVCRNRENSRFRDWFYIDFDDCSRRDGFSYADWDGHQELVKLNLQNPEVRRYLLERADQWIGEFDIDGFRLDTAAILDRDFLYLLCSHIRAYAPDFFFLGEMTGGDYRELLAEGLLNSITDYELKEALVHAFRTEDLRCIADLLHDQIRRGLPLQNLLTFADNHDTDRFASIIKDEKNLSCVYALLTALTGIPCIYYGSEWAAEGKKTPYSDRKVRPEFKHPRFSQLTGDIAAMFRMRSTYSIFREGDFHLLYISEKQMAFRRRSHRGQLTFAMNLSGSPAELKADPEVGQGLDLISRKTVRFSGSMHVPAHSACFWYSDWI